MFGNDGLRLRICGLHETNWHSCQSGEQQFDPVAKSIDLQNRRTIEGKVERTTV